MASKQAMQAQHGYQSCAVQMSTLCIPFGYTHMQFSYVNA